MLAPLDGAFHMANRQGYEWNRCLRSGPARGASPVGDPLQDAGGGCSASTPLNRGAFDYRGSRMLIRRARQALRCGAEINTSAANQNSVREVPSHQPK